MEQMVGFGTLLYFLFLISCLDPLCCIQLLFPSVPCVSCAGFAFRMKLPEARVKLFPLHSGLLFA